MKIKLIVAMAVTLLMAFSAHAETKIRFDGYPDLDSHLKNVLPKFQQENKDIKVDMLMNNHEDHHTKLKTNLATGSGAGDVVAIDVGMIGAMIDSGGFVNLDEAPYNAKQYDGKFAPYSWAQGKGSDGSQYGIPLDLGPGVMYYRRGFMEDMGYQPEDVIKTWDSYIDYGVQLKKKNEKVKLVSAAASVAELIIRTTVKEGESTYFDKEGNSLIQGDRFVNAFTVAKRIRDLGLDRKVQPWTSDWYAGFKEGTVATELSGAWFLGHLKNWIAPDTKGKWGVTYSPNGIFGSWGGSFLCIPNQAENKEAAWKLIQFLSTPYTQTEGLKVIASFPALVETYSNDVFKKPEPFLNGQVPGTIFAEVAKKVVPVAPAKGDLIGWSVIFENAIYEVLDNGRDVKEVLAEADRLMQRRMRKIK